MPNESLVLAPTAERNVFLAPDGKRLVAPEGWACLLAFARVRIYDMPICMRTTIDIPDGLLERARPALAKRHMTLRALVVDALEHLLQPESPVFRLRDASVGHRSESEERVGSDAINRAIEDLGESSL